MVFSYKYRDPHVRNKWTLLNEKQVQEAFLEYTQWQTGDMPMGSNPPNDYLMPPQNMAERISRRIRHLLMEIFYDLPTGQWGHTSPFLIEDESYAETSRWTGYYGRIIANCIVEEEIWRWKTQIMAHITSYLSTIFEGLQRATVERLRLDEANEGTNFHNDYSVRYVPLISICAEQIIAHYKEYIKPVIRR